MILNLNEEDRTVRLDGSLSATERFNLADIGVENA
jgi:hypothetical protein